VPYHIPFAVSLPVFLFLTVLYLWVTDCTPINIVTETLQDANAKEEKMEKDGKDKTGADKADKAARENKDKKEKEGKGLL